MANVLVFIPYDNVCPPRSGGALRAFHCVSELAKRHHLHVVTLQPAAQVRAAPIGSGFPAGVHVYGPDSFDHKPTLFDALPTRLADSLKSRWLKRDLRDPTSSVLLASHEAITNVLRKNSIDIAILTVLESLVVGPIIRRLSPGTFSILNAENVEQHLVLQEMESLPAGARNSRVARRLVREYKRVSRLESDLHRYVDGLWTASDADRQALVRLNPKLLRSVTIPNGVDASTRPFDSRRDKSRSNEVLFCGSLDYRPNIDALEWLHSAIWPTIIEARPGLRLRVVGRGAGAELAEMLRRDPTVEFVGEVSDVVPEYHRAGVCLIPLRAGSGTRLKVLEAMSLGNPVIGTALAVEGIDAVPGRDFICADDPTALANAVIKAVDRPEEFDRIRLNARNLVENLYDWAVIGTRMNKSIASWAQK